MRLITEWTEAAGALAVLRRQSAGWRDYQKDWLPAAEAALEALGPAPHPDDVRKVWPQGIGFIRCDECNAEDVDAVIELGAPPAGDSPTARICAACLLKALQLIEP